MAWRMRAGCALAALVVCLVTACEEAPTTSAYKPKPKVVASPTPIVTPAPQKPKPPTNGIVGGIGGDDPAPTPTPTSTPTPTASASV